MVGISTYLLVAHLSELDLLVILHARVDVHLQLGLLRCELAAVAPAALVLGGDNLAGARAAVTHHLLLSNHAGPELAHDHTDTTALAVGTHDGLAALLTSDATAIRAQHLAGHLQLHSLALVKVCQAHAKAVHHVFTLGGTLFLAATAASTTEHLLKDIAATAATATFATAFVDALCSSIERGGRGCKRANHGEERGEWVRAYLLAVAVVHLPLVLVTQDIVCLLDLLELRWEKSKAKGGESR